MTDARTTEDIAPQPPEGKPKGGARAGAGRKGLDPAEKRKLRSVYATDAGWLALGEHLRGLGFDSVGDFAESLRRKA